MPDERKCARCGSVHTRVIAQSVSPPGDFVQCQNCGHSTLMPRLASKPPAAPAKSTAPGDVDKRRIERLATSVIEAKRAPCRLMGVDKTTRGWRLSMQTEVGDFMAVDVEADSLSAMRETIERALTPAAS